MCGLCGFKDFNQAVNRSRYEEIINVMMNEINHRGPDSGNFKILDNTVLGFRRLSIQDLSVDGDQPFTSKTQNSILLFNGEIYNFLELKEKYFHNTIMSSSSDTEILIELIEKIGIDSALKEVEGMFALVYYDLNTKNLYFARDRLGKKPLYYTLQNEVVVFASELKCLYKFPDLKFKIDNNNLKKFFLFGYVPTPFSIFENIQKLNPGCYVKIDNDKNIKNFKYWDLNIDQFNENQFNQEEFEELVLKSVKKRMISDAPLGTFLSGGIDSTLISYLSSKFNENIRSFSIGNFDDYYDESEFCFKASQIIGTKHNQNYINESKLLDTIESLPRFYDEPFADSSQIPTIINSHFASKEVKVCLSGDGGDELFGGYPRYFLTKRYSKYFKYLKFLKFLPDIKVNNNLSKLINKFNSMKSNDLIGIYKEVVMQNGNMEIIDISENDLIFYPWDEKDKLKKLSSIDLFRYLDLKTYLMDDILTKVDRGSMSESLEVRSPFLDYKIVEYAFYNKFSINENFTKLPLRTMLNKKFSKPFFIRRKQGFSVPVEIIMTKNLKDKCEDLFALKNLKNYELNHKPIIENWAQLKKGNYNNLYGMWFLYMYLDWSRYWESIISK